MLRRIGGPLMVAAALLFAVGGMAEQAAASPHNGSPGKRWAGTYIVSICWQGCPGGDSEFSLTLAAKGVASDTITGDSCSWSIHVPTGSKEELFTLVCTNSIDGTTDTYTGHHAHGGINKAKKPGSATSSPGGVTGTWFAVLQPGT